MKKMPEGSLMTLFFAYCNIILGSEQKNVGGVSVNERMCLKNAETLAHGMIGGGVGRGGEGGIVVHEPTTLPFTSSPFFHFFCLCSAKFLFSGSKFVAGSDKCRRSERG